MIKYAIGPDISSYQEHDATPEGIDFRKMNENADFVIVRAGQNQRIDTKFRKFWEGSKEARIPRGSACLRPHRW